MDDEWTMKRKTPIPLLLEGVPEGRGSNIKHNSLSSLEEAKRAKRK